MPRPPSRFDSCLTNISLPILTGHLSTICQLPFRHPTIRRSPSTCIKAPTIYVRQVRTLTIDPSSPHRCGPHTITNCQKLIDESLPSCLCRCIDACMHVYVCMCIRMCDGMGNRDQIRDCVRRNTQMNLLVL